MSWEIKPIEDMYFVFCSGIKLPQQTMDGLKQAGKKCSVCIFADKRMKNSMTDKEIKALPSERYNFYIDKIGLRNCKIWFEL